ncbi:MAG: DUF3568 family protein [Candidatus Omnitrophica bacterium]|nr:DUF3568 family protein [Candidatus Omnitrophota bacterium]
MFAKNIKLSCVLCLLSCLLVSGCVPLIIGAGIVTGYLVTKDTVSGNLEVSFDELWKAAVGAVQEKADITDQNKEAGIIRAKLRNDEIVVKVKELTETSQNLRVTARKVLALAHLDLAQEVFTKIIRNLDKVTGKD